MTLENLNDYVTDVNGETRLKNRSVNSTILGDYILISIEQLGFIGTAAQLLKRHGLIYFRNGINALILQEKMLKEARLRIEIGE